ncbi:class I SAM-dependent methyltransferase [Actinocrispum sp. NPDC049592]|uniref:class I SAM-dependent methyltransferase n=1 Tax=Actinocrispum sp. NPDC049592 TaxID=3154835 RepID=UPI00341840EF
MSTPEAELRARRAGSFGAQARAYAEHRPDYPDPAIDWVLPPDPVHVLDLAAGTGKLTQSLVARGLRVTAVEPDPGMRAELRKRFPGTKALAGTAEDIPLAGASVDAVLVGQAFHWFDVPKALNEIGRVLRPGGALGAMWNLEDERVEWVAQFEELIRPRVSREWTARNPMPDRHPLFEPFQQQAFDHSFRRTAETLAATVGTHSHMLVSSDEDRAAVLTRLHAFLESRPETAGGGEFEVPLRTLVMRTYRR